MLEPCLWRRSRLDKPQFSFLTAALLPRNQSIPQAPYEHCIKKPIASAFTCYSFWQAAFEEETSFSRYFCYSFITFKDDASYLRYSNTASQPSKIILQVGNLHHTKTGTLQEHITLKKWALATTLPFASRSSGGVRKQQQKSRVLSHILQNPLHQPFNTMSSSSLNPRIRHATSKFPEKGRALKWQDQRTFMKALSCKYPSLITDHLPHYLRE